MTHINDEVDQLIAEFCDLTNFDQYFVINCYSKLMTGDSTAARDNLLEYSLYLCTYHQKEIDNPDLRVLFSKHFYNYYPKWLSGVCPIIENDNEYGSNLHNIQKDIRDVWSEFYANECCRNTHKEYKRAY
jgi:hypothetical protein